MISIIIPTYNRSKFIKNCIDSAINQIHKDIEIIVIDDGSQDDTFDLLCPYIETKIIKYIYQNNQGVSSARNKGILESKGEFVAFLDSDDFWHRNHLSSLVTHLKKCEEADIAFSDFIFIGERMDVDENNRAFNRSKQIVLKKSFGKINENLWISKGNLLETFLMHGFPFRIQGTLIKKNFLIKNNLLFDTNVSYTEEAQFILESALKTKMIFVEDATLLIRRHEENYNDICYDKKKIVSFENRIKRMKRYFNKKLTSGEKKALNYALWDMQTTILKNKIKNANYCKRVKESFVLFKKVPSYLSLKTAIKMTLSIGT